MAAPLQLPCPDSGLLVPCLRGLHQIPWGAITGSAGLREVMVGRGDKGNDAPGLMSSLAGEGATDDGRVISRGYILSDNNPTVMNYSCRIQS